VKRFVNGVEAEIPDDSEASVERLPDRLAVRGPDGMHTALAVRSGDSVLVSYRGRQFTVERSAPRARAQWAAHSGEIHAPMPGLIVDVLTKTGKKVRRGDKLVVLEAMKTQQAFVAPFDGRVVSVGVEKGAQIVEGELLVVVEPEGGD